MQKSIEGIDGGTIQTFIQKSMEMYKVEKEKIGCVNIIIAGKTGVGKSTLINAVFRENLAKTGIGEPVTETIRRIAKPGVPAVIYDTVGFELGEKRQKQSIKEIKDKIEEKQVAPNVKDHIHCLWYCVDACSDRFEDTEVEFINEMAEYVPVVIVLTKAFIKGQAKRFASAINSRNTHAKNICIVLAGTVQEEDQIIRAYGVEELIHYTIGLLPELVREAWANATTSLELKRQAAMTIVKQTTAASFMTGFTPIPLSDAPLLITAEVQMMVRISTVYGVDLTKNLVKGVASGLLGVGTATLAGRTIVSNVLKMFPGIGTVVGGAISGGVASALTLAVGKTYIELMEMIAKGEISKEELDSEEMQEKMRSIMKEKMAEKD